MDLIIPETDIPGAKQLKLPEFLDGFIGVIFNAKAKENIAKQKVAQNQHQIPNPLNTVISLNGGAGLE